MDALCRCCLSKETDVSILQESNLKEKFYEITTVEVKINDNLPKNICKDCLEVLNTSYRFRQQCIKMDEQLRAQLENMIAQANLKSGFHNYGKEPEPSDDDDFDTNPLKQLEALIKKEPTDSDDDCYVVLVINENDKDEKEKTTVSSQFMNVKIEKQEPEQIPPESEMEEQNDEKNNNFQIDSFLLSNKVPDNVPATILANEEESQGGNSNVQYEEYEQENYITIDTLDNNTQVQFVQQGDEEIQDDSDIVKTITGKIVNGPDGKNYIKILGTEGTILLNNAKQITYLSDNEELIANEVVDSNAEREVIFYDGEDSSQFQVLKVDGSEMVIEYTEDSQLATMLQQEDNTYVCDCGEQFDDAEKYEKHQLTHNPGEDHLCNLCGKGFESIEILTGHTLLHNKTGPLIVCPYCDTPIKRNVLTQHIKYRHSYVKPNCQLCSKTFANPHNLKRHMLIHKGIKEFQCDICFKRFQQKITMQTHKITHINPHTCHACDLAFANKEDLNEHKSGNKCSKSKLKKIKEELLKTIKQVITTNLGKILGYACSLCKKMFSMESALEQHIATTHIFDPNDLLCTECGEVMSSKHSLDSHATIHKNCKLKNAKRFPCSICGKGCASHAMLIMHERVHTNERPFNCPNCSLRFKTKTHLRTHQLTHTKEKKFGCSICMKFFALKGNLVVHLRTHTGERPYVCSLCNEAFIDTKYLKKHKLKKHAIENVPWHQY